MLVYLRCLTRVCQTWPRRSIIRPYQMLNPTIWMPLVSFDVLKRWLLKGEINCCTWRLQGHVMGVVMWLSLGPLSIPKFYTLCWLHFDSLDICYLGPLHLWLWIDVSHYPCTNPDQHQQGPSIDWPKSLDAFGFILWINKDDCSSESLIVTWRPKGHVMGVVMYCLWALFGAMVLLYTLCWLHFIVWTCVVPACCT